MKQIFILIFLLSFIKVKAQDSLIDKSADSILSSAVNSLNESDFYFVAQAHGNQANSIIERGLLFSLNKKFNVRYYILETGQSLAFLLNQYLETGQDSILETTYSKANFDIVKRIKIFNDTVADSKKIKFFGVDFEGSLNGKWIKKAIKIISDKIRLPANHPLQILLNAVINPQPGFEKENLASLKAYLNKNDPDCRLLLGKYYIDVLLISNAQFGFSPKRDKAMFANFKLLYSEITRTEENPKFFASFGWAHINPENKNGLPHRLLEDEDSPIKGKVSIIGTQYYNCTFNVRTPASGPAGTLRPLCKKSEIKQAEKLNDTKERTISFFKKSELKNFGCNDAINKLSGLIIVRNFPGTTLWEL